jgi:hypothetical protein
VVVWTTFCPQNASGRTLPKSWTTDGTEREQCRDRWQTTFDRESRREWTRDEEELIKDMHLFRPK